MVRELSTVLMTLLLFVASDCCAEEPGQFVDPMRPIHYQSTINSPSSIPRPALKPVNTKAWKLTAILISAQRSVAVINGKPLQEGAVLNGYRLVRIGTDEVLLKSKQRKIVLHRAGTGLKKTSMNRDAGKGSKP